jgi:hypothetical protein
MKLISVQLARMVWSFDASEVNPRGKNIFKDLVPELIQRYEFKGYPQEGGDFKEGLKFTQGTFVNSANDPVTVGMTVWSDGLGVDAYSSTKDCDEFLDETCKILSGIGYVLDPGIARRKTYLSQVVVRSSKPLRGLNPGLEEFSKKISSAFGGATTFGFSGIEFYPDQTQVYKPSTFSFQKRIGDAFSDDRYWSQAPLPTDKHLELLNEMEALLS